MSLHARRAARLAAVAAAFVSGLVPLASLGQAGVVNITTGGVEVRAFHPTSTTSAIAASYGGGLYNITSVTTAPAVTRINTVPGNVRYFTSIAGNASQIVAAGVEGAVRSTDGGANWARVNYDSVTAVAMPTVASTTVLLGVPGIGILRSTDGGLTFAPANNAAFDSTDITAVTFQVGSTTVAYAASLADFLDNRGGIFKSTDGGATWAALTPALPASGASCSNRWVRGLTADASNNLYAAILRPCDNNGDVLRLANGAGAWTASGDPFFGANTIHQDLNLPGDMWAGTKVDGPRFKASASTTYFRAGGSTGTESTYRTGVQAIQTFSGNTFQLMAVRGAGVYRTSGSTAGSGYARTYTKLAFPGADRVQALTNVGASGLIAGLYMGGPWYSANGSTGWTEPGPINFPNASGADNRFVTVWGLSSSSDAATVYAAVGPLALYLANDPYSAVLKLSGTTSWSTVGSNGSVVEGGLSVGGIPFTGIAVNPSNPANVTVATLTVPGFIHRNGAWGAPPGTGTFGRDVMTNASGGVTLAFPADDKALISTDLGNTYAQFVGISQAGFERQRFLSASHHPSTPNIWVAATKKGLYSSTDNASNWTRLPMAGALQDVVMTGVGYRSDGRVFAGDFDGNRYCSANNGNTWVALPALRASVNGIKVIAGNVYYLTDGAGIFLEQGTC